VSVLADTSAFYAHIVKSEATHDRVREAFASLMSRRRPIWTTSFVIVETMALLQHRIGLDAGER